MMGDDIFVHEFMKEPVRKEIVVVDNKFDLVKAFSFGISYISRLKNYLFSIIRKRKWM